MENLLLLLFFSRWVKYTLRYYKYTFFSSASSLLFFLFFFFLSSFSSSSSFDWDERKWWEKKIGDGKERVKVFFSWFTIVVQIFRDEDSGDDKKDEDVKGWRRNDKDGKEKMLEWWMKIERRRVKKTCWFRVMKNHSFSQKYNFLSSIKSWRKLSPNSIHFFSSFLLLLLPSVCRSTDWLNERQGFTD